MIFLARAKLVILLQPKTGTTALERALTSRSSVVVRQPAPLKHISYRGFMKFIAPWIETQAGIKRSDYQVVSVVREPIDWLGSWYRYRANPRPNNHKRKLYTGDITFEQYVLDVCLSGADRPAYAQIKTPSWCALHHRDSIGIDMVYPYEDMSGLYALIEARTGKKIELKQANTSPSREVALSAHATELIRQKFAFDFDLHAHLVRDGSVDPRFRVNRHPHEPEDLSPAYRLNLGSEEPHTTQ